MGERIRNIEAPEGDGNSSKVVLSKAVNIIRNIEAPEGDGNDLLRPR